MDAPLDPHMALHLTDAAALFLTDCFHIEMAVQLNIPIPHLNQPSPLLSERATQYLRQMAVVLVDAVLNPSEWP